MRGLAEGRERGHVIDGDQLMALIATSWHARGHLQGGGLVATVMSNLGLERYLESQQLKLVRAKVGDGSTPFSAAPYLGSDLDVAAAERAKSTKADFIAKLSQDGKLISNVEVHVTLDIEEFKAMGDDPRKTAIAALAKYRNVKRRLELRGAVRGISVYDDFAHHPTAIAATLQALRATRMAPPMGARSLALVHTDPSVAARG